MSTLKDFTKELDEIFNAKSTTEAQVYIRKNRLMIDYNKTKLTFSLIPDISLVSKTYDAYARRLEMLIFKYKPLIKQILFDEMNAKQKELEYYVQTQQLLIYSF